MSRQTEWDALAAWWLEEIVNDPAYETEVLAMLLDLLPRVAGRRVLDLGCGEGRIMRALGEQGAQAIGCDVSAELARLAARMGPVVLARLPSLDFLRDACVDTVVAVLVLEHLEELQEPLASAARVTRPGGHLVVVMNHPLFSAPGSGPVVDPEDDEMFWRWGEYLSKGTTIEPAGPHEVVFHHRPLSAVLNAAADGGWCLEEAQERAAGAELTGRVSLLAGQTQVPRLLGARWRLGRGAAGR
jgi:SAM-dependent methyltransferase